MSAGEPSLPQRPCVSCAAGALAPHPLAYFIHPPPSTTPFLKRVCACAFLPRLCACLVNKRVLLLPRVRACFFSCTGLGLSSSSYRPSAPRWVGSFTRCGAPSRAQKNCSSFLHDDCRGTRSNPSPVLPLPGVVSEPPLAHRQDRAANIAKTRKYFDVTVKNETGPTLFHTWEGYEAHLPRREASSGPPLDLSRRGRLAIGPRIHGPTCSTSRAPKVAKGLVAQRA